MGKRDRERIERIRKGLEQPIARKAVAIASRSGVIRELSKGTTVDQVDRLNTLVGEGVLPSSKLGKAIMDKAPREMDKGIKKLQKQNKKVTVDALLYEVKTTPGFLKMCQNAGISLEWFEKLARERMEAHRL